MTTLFIIIIMIALNLALNAPHTDRADNAIMAFSALSLAYGLIG